MVVVTTEYAKVLNWKQVFLDYHIWVVSIYIHGYIVIVELAVMCPHSTDFSQ